jgi:hypothetical protein
VEPVFVGSPLFSLPSRIACRDDGPSMVIGIYVARSVRTHLTCTQYTFPGPM